MCRSLERPGREVPDQELPKQIDAKRFLTTIEGAKLTGDYVNPVAGKALFGERLVTWLDATVNMRPATRARDERYGRSLILPHFENCPLASIDHDAIQDWAAELVSAGKAPTTVAEAHQIMSKVITSAVKAWLITHNPCADTEPPKVERDEPRFLVPAEVAKLTNTIDPAARVLGLTAAYSGLRIGELFGLRVGRVDNMRATVEAAEIRLEVKGAMRCGPPTTRAGCRVAPIPRSAQRVCPTRRRPRTRSARIHRHRRQADAGHELPAPGVGTRRRGRRAGAIETA